jgi:DNA-binding CsgD family transcriptional regulator
MRRKKTQRNSENGNATATTVGDGLLIVDGSLRTVALDRGAEAILNDLNGANGGSANTDGNATLPGEIMNLLNTHPEQELDRASMHVRVGNREYSCRTLLVLPKTDAVVQPMMALYLKRELSIMDAVHQAGADYHLTDREQEALIGVTMGLTSKELAHRMQISPNTVKAFLRLIMIKMGVPTRAAIVGKLLDQSGLHDSSE